MQSNPAAALPSWRMRGCALRARMYKCILTLTCTARVWKRCLRLFLRVWHNNPPLADCNNAFWLNAHALQLLHPLLLAKSRWATTFFYKPILHLKHMRINGTRLIGSIEATRMLTRQGFVVGNHQDTALVLSPTCIRSRLTCKTQRSLPTRSVYP